MMLIHRSTIKGKALDTFLSEVLKGSLDEGVVIGCNIRHIGIIGRILVRAAYAHHRYIGLMQSSLNFRVIIIGNNAVTTPFIQMVEARHKVFFQIQIPVNL